MRRIAFLLIAFCLAVLATSADVQARGGRGRRGGGHSYGGGHSPGGYSRGGHSRGGYSRGGYSRPTASRSPSMSRPSPSYGRGGRSASPYSSRPTTRPGAGAQPGARPTQGQLNRFLNVSHTGSGRAGSPTSRYGAGTAAGGAAGAFLSSHPQSGSFGYGNRQDRQGQRTGTREGRQGDRTAAREGRQGERAGAREGRQTERTEQRTDLASSRPDRVGNAEERQQQRLSRQDEVRQQFQDNHPRAEFWGEHPYWARWAVRRPYRWATWGMIAASGSGYASQPAYYEYGQNVYYQGDTVYYGDQAVASSEEYAQQAQELAESAPDPAEGAAEPGEGTPEATDEEWLSLGVFAVTQDSQSSGPPPTVFFQLAVNQEGVIAGTMANTESEDVRDIEGMVDGKSQRSAWVVSGKEWPVMETSIANLTKDAAPALCHFADGRTQQWLLVRLEDPEKEAGAK